MWYCKIVDGAINCFANSDNVAIGDEMIPLPEGLDPTNVQVVIAEDGSVTLQADHAKLEAKTAQAWTDLRTRRNQLLTASDWTQLADTHMSQDKKDAWATYRQELRDLPETVTSPTDLVPWPLDPTQVTPVAPSGSRLGNLLNQA